MKQITLGKFEVGQEVRPKNRNSYAADRRGTVCEVSPTGDRVRVSWGKRANGVAAKRTWMAATSLVQVVPGAPDPFPEKQPAVGPDGWLLDTND